jgi:hypothetical protein
MALTVYDRKVLTFVDQFIVLWFIAGSALPSARQIEFCG